jgi:uncharacterized protein YgiB involved in biofilm formation
MVHVTLLGASAFALSACEEERPDLTFFESVQQCRSAAANFESIAVADCDAAFATARQEHATLAPRYESAALCAEQHGADACAPQEQVLAAVGAADGSGEPQQVAQGGGSIFMPMLAGYMMGQMLRGGSPAYAGRPLYSDRQGALRTTDGQRQAFTRPGSTVKGSPASITPRTAAQPRPVMTRATVAQSGGFGATRTSSSSSRSFGS